MNIADALANLSSLVAQQRADLRELSDSAYIIRRGATTTYMASSDYQAYGCDRSVVAAYLQERFAERAVLSEESRAALFTTYLIAVLIANTTGKLLVLSAGSAASRSVSDDAALLTMFDHVVTLPDCTLQPEGSINVLMPKEAVALTEGNVLVAIGCAPAEVAMLFEGKKLPRHGVVLFQKDRPVKSLSNCAPSAVTVVHVQVDLGDGPTMGAYWGVEE